MNSIRPKEVVRSILLILVAVCIPSLSGCGNDHTANTNTASSNTKSNATPASNAPATSYRAKSGATGTITANPNPIRVCDGSGLGVTNISWNFSGAKMAQVRVGSPSGGLLTTAGGPGTTATGKWVGAGSTFYLQDISNGQEPSADNTIAAVTVNVTTQGCP
jgi:hypothetical protein